MNLEWIQQFIYLFFGWKNWAKIPSEFHTKCSKTICSIIFFHCPHCQAKLLGLLRLTAHSGAIAVASFLCPKAVYIFLVGGVLLSLLHHNPGLALRLEPRKLPGHLLQVMFPAVVSRLMPAPGQLLWSSTWQSSWELLPPPPPLDFLLNQAARSAQDLGLYGSYAPPSLATMQNSLSSGLTIELKCNYIHRAAEDSFCTSRYGVVWYIR